MALDQTNRRLHFEAAGISQQPVVLTGFRGHEELSRLFWFDLDLISDDTQIEHTKVIGKPMEFAVKFEEDTPRPFYGYVSQFSVGAIEEWMDGPGNPQYRRRYHARVVPWMWFLTRQSNCRIFFKKTVPEIIEQVFKDAGFQGDWQSKLEHTADYPQREYCVQYRETDFNFVSRLMEEEGIFYYFKHDKDQQKHILNLCDSTNAWFDCQDIFVALDGDTHQVDHFVEFTHWEHIHEFRAGKWAQTDYDFKTSKQSLVKSEPTKSSYNSGIDNSKFELFDYPGFPDIDKSDKDNKEDGTRLTKIRMEEEETGNDVVHASSKYRSFSPGGAFAVGKDFAKFEKVKKFVVTSVQHVAHETAQYETGGSTGDDYHNTFTCADAAEQFRPARLTPKPVVHGAQTALVVGPSGEEIWCDEYGRVKAEFYWDRAGTSPSQPEQRSCWMRVANNLAGKQWGFVAIPRIGQEVVVEFLEGDPDRPLIVGSVYNDNQKLHYSLAEGADRDKNKTKTYFVTNSSAGGKGYNELMFDDKADSEQVYIHAQKNMDLRVGNDSKERIYGNHHEVIGWEKDGDKGGSHYQYIHKDKHAKVMGDQIEQVEGNMQLFLGGGDPGDGNLDTWILGNDSHHVDKNYGLTVGGNKGEKIAKDASLNITGNQNVKVGQTAAMEAGQTVHIKAGMTLILEAGMQLSLKVGGNFIDIGPAGVSIFGTMVMINSGGSAGSGPDANPVDPQDAQMADPTKPAQALDGFTGNKSCD